MGEKIAEIISRMSRDDFYKHIVEGVAKSHEFSVLVVGGPAALTGEQRESLLDSLVLAGVDKGQLEADEDWAELAIAIAGRSVTLT